MAEISKGRSPFYPGQPVPVELFVGRRDPVDRLLRRGAGQVAAGKPVAAFIQGEYGIGKSCVANYVQRVADLQYGLHGIYVPPGGARSAADLGALILEATLRSAAHEARRGEQVRNWLARYVGNQSLFGFTLNLEALRQDAPTLSTPAGLLEYLGQAVERLRDAGVRGIFLVLDEINGISGDPQFAQFLKTLVDLNALSGRPVPLLLVLCGVEERRREMIQKHPPADRLFDVIEIEPMGAEEMRELFERAFASVGLAVTEEALETLVLYSGGFPKIMHVVGDAAYWVNQDEVIDRRDADAAILMAADEVGRKFVDQQVYTALRSADYRSILDKIAQIGPEAMRLTRAEVASGLTETERRKLDDFLRRMMKLNVIRPGEARGEYVFNLRLVRLYIWLQSYRGTA